MTNDSGSFDARKVREKADAEVSGGLGLLSLGMGLSRSQLALVVRVGWVLMVSTHILWACGLLTSIGLAAPFARADDVEGLKRTAEISVRLQLTNEIRVQTRIWCDAKEPSQRATIEQSLDRLREEYRQVTKGEQPPEYRCTP